MATASTASRITRKIGIAVKKAVSRKKGWYDLHMAAASGAIAQRLPLVDLVAEIRDARIPLSSEYELLRDFPALSKRIVVMNKIDLADQTQVKGWMRYFEQQNCIPYGVNSHNKDSVKGLLNFIQAQVRGLCKANHHASETITIMLVGIPNVGKSALANSLHQMGRISAAEKGRLKHATVSPQPGETKDISSFKIGSHPNIYLLDTPGILPCMIHDAELCSKLVLTGAIRDGLIEQKELARYFLAILNLSDQYKKWAKFSANEDRLLSFIEHKEEGSISSKLEMRQKKQHMMDHTQLLMQDLIVNDVRGTIFDTISCFDGDIELEEDMIKLMEAELVALRDAFRVPQGLGEYVFNRVVGVKLLDLYRSGRLGHYTLDTLPLTLHHPL
ncbi:DAR GTPase 2, mitochondrial isoform X1 [Gossypium arboreum]|uniref:DAR GTPase 2, mitochondrial isoform X1 n=1 Tax=Gossypium arboreum TaxID=29729 RepID=UPI0022F1A85E|nr:DAR GTPase 2, mitochondrial isoform X1 [Gossypium arboreum]